MDNNDILRRIRFAFDFETMERIKVNDRYEFPLEIDMREYLTKEVLSEFEFKNNKFNGVSILSAMNAGTIQFGIVTDPLIASRSTRSHSSCSRFLHLHTTHFS